MVLVKIVSYTLNQQIQLMVIKYVKVKIAILGKNLRRMELVIHARNTQRYQIIENHVTLKYALVEMYLILKDVAFNVLFILTHKQME